MPTYEEYMRVNTEKHLSARQDDREKGLSKEEEQCSDGNYIWY